MHVWGGGTTGATTPGDGVQGGGTIFEVKKYNFLCQKVYINLIKYNKSNSIIVIFQSPISFGGGQYYYYYIYIYIYIYIFTRYIIITILYIYIYTHYIIITVIYIQGDLGGICNTLGNDSMCDS